MFGSALLQPARSVWVSLSAFFSLKTAVFSHCRCKLNMFCWHKGRGSAARAHATKLDPISGLIRITIRVISAVQNPFLDPRAIHPVNFIHTTHRPTGAIHGVLILCWAYICSELPSHHLPLNLAAVFQASGQRSIEFPSSIIHILRILAGQSCSCPPCTG